MVVVVVRPTPLRVVLVWIQARLELAETLEVSGGTHATRGEALTRV